MAEAKVDDATLKLLQDYAATVAERLGLQARVRASNGRAVMVTITREADGERCSFCHPHPYSSHHDAVQFIDRILKEACNAFRL